MVDTVGGWIVDRVENVEQAVGDTANRAAQYAQQAYQTATEWTADAARAAINAALRAFGADPMAFWGLVDPIVSQLVSFYRHADDIAQRLFQASEKALGHFFNNLLQTALKGVVDWATGPLSALADVHWDLLLDALQAFGQWDVFVQKILAFFLDFFGLDWDRILGAIVNAIFAAIPFAGAVVEIFHAAEGLVEAADNGWDGVRSWIWMQVQQGINLIEQFGRAVLDQLAKQLPVIVLQWVASLTPAGGIGKALKTVADVAIWVWTHRTQLLGLLESVQKGVQVLLTETDYGPVATWIEGVLEQATRAAVSAVADVGANAAGLGFIRDAVVSFLSNTLGVVPTKIGEWVTLALNRVVQEVKDLWRAQNSVVGPVSSTEAGPTVKVWVSGTGGTLQTWYAVNNGTAQMLEESATGQSVLHSVARQLQTATQARRPTGSAGRAGPGNADRPGVPGKPMGAPSQPNTAKLSKQAVKAAQTVANAIAHGQMGSTCPVRRAAACFGVGAHWQNGIGGNGAIEKPAIGGLACTVEAGEPVMLEVSAAEDYDPRTARVVELLQEAEGERHGALLLRTGEWLAAAEVRVGGVVEMNLPEMGMVGPARVVAIHPCPELVKGKGRRVTGWFRHTGAQVYELWVEGEPEAFRVTGQHPFWSVDRGGWVAVAELEPGERLLGMHGTRPRVESLGLRAEREPVYNIEVEGDHCYRVGQQGLLVHNASWGMGHMGCDPCDTATTLTRVIYRSGRPYSITFEAVTPSGSNRQVCRVRSVSGIIRVQANPGDSTNVRAQMRRFFFNVGQTQTPQQVTLAGQYDAGHVIAASLGGPNEVENLVPMWSGLNQAGGAWRAMEIYITGCLNRAGINATGMMEVMITYPQSWTDPIDKYIPSRFVGSFTLTDSSGNTRTQNFNFKNDATATARNFVMNCV